ncbi:MAG TPA: ATP-dependent DNA ligase [Actinomycetota bacterium]|nr:ATP-dependent DNA ligase [Actinomycetota bacterium]
MNLPVMPPVSPMLAKLARELPAEGGMLYEPKWDGFRCIVFRDGDEVELGSRNERPLTRYFPELLDPLRDQLPPRCVLDGEIVIAGPGGRLEFEALLQRIHPAASRITLLAAQTPASFVAFDLLAEGDDDLRSLPQIERRARLEAVLREARPPLHITPCTTDRALAAEWFDAFEGAGLDGVVAKPEHLPYREGERVMLKVKHERTADCVVAGFRWHKSGGVVGSLLLGLFDAGGTLHHVGVTASFTAARRKELVDTLAPYRDNALDGHPWGAWASAMAAAGGRMPGAQSRWNAGKDQSWEPVRPELVVEVRYDHLQGDRFRHGTTFVRFRDDRSPESCTYAQLDEAAPAELAQIFGT